MVSVVMATYNGENYIYEQMRSIYEQTRQADEVLICDDCSKDRTTAIIDNFIKTHGLNNWKLIINDENKGWQRNFVEALGQVSGSYIFFSDQDDIWFKDKIEIMMNFMEKNPEIHCLSGKMTTIDGNGTEFQGRNIFSAGNGSGNLIKQNFSTNFNTIILQGCTMCITRTLANLVIRMNIKNYAHDAQCCKLGILLDGVYILDRPIIHYRLHDHNTSGVVSDINYGSSNLQKRIKDIKRNIIWLERLLKIYDSEEVLEKKKKRMVEETIEFQKERFRFLSDRKLIHFLKLLKYRKYYSGFSMYIGDFTYAFHINKIAGKILWHIRNVKKLKG